MVKPSVKKVNKKDGEDVGEVAQKPGDPEYMKAYKKAQAAALSSFSLREEQVKVIMSSSGGGAQPGLREARSKICGASTSDLGKEFEGVAKKAKSVNEMMDELSSIEKDLEQGAGSWEVSFAGLIADAESALAASLSSKK